MRSITPFILLASLLVACDQIKDPVPPSVPGQPVDTTDTGIPRRKVLLEDFTGHKCNNCPGATNIAVQLENSPVFGDDVVVVGVHATFFAVPQPGPNGSYATDFRTEAGNTYAQAFGINNLPTGMVNRTEYSSSITLEPSFWATAVSEMAGIPAAFDVQFKEFSYNSTNHSVTTTVQVAVVEPINGDHNLTIYLTEDHVIDWQLNSQASPPDVEFYDHRHVLRANLNGTWGTPIITGSADVGDTLLVNANFSLQSEWNAANCALVAYVANAETNEVMQAADRKFQP